MSMMSAQQQGYEHRYPKLPSQERTSKMGAQNWMFKNTCRKYKIDPKHLSKMGVQNVCSNMDVEKCVSKIWYPTMGVQNECPKTGVKIVGH